MKRAIPHLVARAAKNLTEAEDLLRRGTDTAVPARDAQH